MSPDQIAEAFSSHRFEVASPHVAENVQWNNVGGDRVAGRDALVAKCAELSQYLSTVTTAFSHLRVTRAGERVVVESVATYTDGAGEVSTVASCDVYDFVADRIAAITSYNIELAN